MRILMFGRGAIATVYGWALEQAGHEVEFYVRPGRSELYGQAVELDLLDARHGMSGKHVVQRWPVRYRETLSASDGFDLIVLSVAHHRLSEAATFLAGRIGNATVLVFSNLLGEPVRVVEPLRPEQLAWGFPGAGGSFRANNQLYGTLLPSVTFGTLGNPPTNRERMVRTLFRQAGFRVNEQADFRGWLFLHFLMNAGIHSQALRVGTLSSLKGSRSDLQQALLTSRELLPIAEANGVDLRRHRGMVAALRAPSFATAQLLAWVTRYVPLARRSLEAHTDPATEEPRAICRDTLAEATRLGIEVPRLTAAEPLFAVSENRGS